MHEMPIAENIFRIVREQKNLNNLKKVYKINLKIGKLTTVVPSALKFCFQVISKGTEFENVKLDIEIVPFKIKCKKCLKEEEISEFFFLCPFCESENIEVISGRELFIDSIEGE